MELLVDTGADRTVISANVLALLDIETTSTPNLIAGVGGIVESVVFSSQMRFSRDDGQKALFHGDYIGCPDHEALDMSVLGRDVLDLFALIIDRQAERVALIAGQHQYTIANQSGVS